MMSSELQLTVRQAFRLHFLRLGHRYLLGAIVLGVVMVWAVLFRAPFGFPTGEFIEITPGTSVRAAGAQLEEANIIDSPLLFKALVRVMVGTRGVQSGVYRFSQPVGVYTVAWNLSKGVSGIPRIRVTFPEGTMVSQMGDILATKIPGFSKSEFMRLAEDKEGFLFPDTYFFLPDTNEETVVAHMHDTYLAHIEELEDEIASSGRTEEEIITMASLLEGEGKTLEDKRMIAGILWRRLDIGMALQVDAVFSYILNKPGYAPKPDDLKVNSPYNTYRYRGLPPGPINNPGEVSIRAALTPTKSEYLYYITGTDGKMYYAKTFGGHVENQRKYLWD